MRHYAMHIGDYAAATAHLSDAEDLAYRRLLDAYYAREAPLPTDEAACCRLARATCATARRAVVTVLREFFQPSPDGWRQKRCDDEISRCRAKSAGARDAVNVRHERDRAARRSQDERREIERTSDAQSAYGRNTDVIQTHSGASSSRIPPITHYPLPITQSVPTATEASLPTPTVPPTPEVKSVDATAKNPRSRPAKTPASEAKSTTVWQAYATAYALRYGVEPVRNAKASAMLCQLVDRLGDDAPHVASAYLRSSRGLYVAARHAVDLLLRDAEGLRTDWATGRAVTDTQARQADRTAATGSTFGRLIGEATRDGTHG